MAVVNVNGNWERSETEAVACSVNKNADNIAVHRQGEKALVSLTPATHLHERARSQAAQMGNAGNMRRLCRL